MRVLLIEDNASTARSIELALSAESMVCDTTCYGEEGVEIGKIYDYDIIILDLMLPDMSGYDVLNGLRSGKVQVPILILSGLSNCDNKVKGLGAGADDYLTKPFSITELVARIQAIVRRSKGHADSIIKVDDRMVINLANHTVSINNIPVHLTRKEYSILELLALRQGSLITKEMLLNHLYGGMDEPDLKIIDVFVCKLRKKINEILRKS